MSFQLLFRSLLCGLLVPVSAMIAYSEPAAAAAAASPISASKMVPREICRSYVQCRRELLERVDKCPGGDSSREITSNNNNNESRNRECSAAAKSKMQLLRTLQKQMQQQQLNCVQNRVNESVPIYPRKPRVCNQKVLDAYTQFVNTTALHNSINSSATATTPGNNENVVYEKWMREVKIQNQQERRRRDRRSSSSGGTSTTTTIPPRSNMDTAARKRCADDISEYQRQCAMLTKCCSEVDRCEDDLKSSPLYSEISQLHLDIFNQLRQCQEK